MLQYVEKFERFVYAALIVMLMVVVVFALGELAYQFVLSVTNVPELELSTTELTSVLGIFLLILIAVELLDTMIAYLKERMIHVEVVVLLAIIAISRKVILLDPNTTTGTELIGIGIVIIGLAGAYYLLKKAGYTLGTKDLPKGPAE